MYRYHSQHSALVEDVIKSKRQPLEKKLRDHVKLSKWDEQSYYSLKESNGKIPPCFIPNCQRVQKNLELPVAPFIDQHVNSNEGAGGADDLHELRVSTSPRSTKSMDQVELKEIPSFDKVNMHGSKVLSLLPKIYKVMRKEN